MTSRSIGKTASSVGMMEGAFFVSRTELLDWVNGLLSVNLTKVEQCASGAIYCQIVDACHPGTVKMNKVNWMARADHEYIPNYKILQAAFDRNHIEKHIDVDKLIRAKYQDNLEFLQWMKAMWDREGTKPVYDAVRARDGRPVPTWATAKPLQGASSGAGAEKENLSANREGAPATKAAPSAGRRPGSGYGKVAPQRETVPRSGVRPAATAAKAMASEIEELKQKHEEELAQREEDLVAMENERDFYFRKLRNVEILCTTLQEKPDPTMDIDKLLSQITGLLYAENDGADEEALDATVDGPVDEEVEAAA